MLQNYVVLLMLAVLPSVVNAQWKEIYNEDFDDIAVSTETGASGLSQWEKGSALGVVFDGKTKEAGRFLIPRHAWNSFNQGPILSLDLAAYPHDKVKVSFDLYTFGDWRGFQRNTGGPHHRLMFFDSKATPAFSFDTSYATNPAYKQGWPGKNNQANPARTGGAPIKLDMTGRFQKAFKWPVEFEYSSDSSSLRFTILCGAAAGSGKPMPVFGVDNVRVSLRSTAPTIVVDNNVDTTNKLQRKAVMRPGEHLPVTFRVAPHYVSGENSNRPGKTSVGIYNQQGTSLLRTLMTGESLEPGVHTILWDGRDDTGKPLPAGDYKFKRITTSGFTARYLTTIGINPPGGEHPTPRRSWVGDHVGAGTIDLSSAGLFIGSTMTEGLMMAVGVKPDLSEITWRREQFYEGGRLTRLAATNRVVYMLHPTGKIRQLDATTGQVQATWNVVSKGLPPADMDANDKTIGLTYPSQNKVVWLDPKGKPIADNKIESPGLIALESTHDFSALVVSRDRQIVRCKPNQPAVRVAQMPLPITAVDYDPSRQELWVLLEGHKVILLDKNYRVQREYTNRPRPLGPYDNSLIAGANDIAADGEGGFWIAEPFQPPRRVAHYDAEGKIQNEWFGGMSFYVSAAFDPADPTVLYGIASEGYVHQYRINFKTGDWTIEACYHTGRLGDGLFPNSGSFRVIHQNDAVYLYHRIVPSVIRLDAKSRQAVPVAVAGRVLNQGRTFVQFAGSGQDGYPKPWVTAAKYHGYTNLATVPKLYSWADSNGDGQFSPNEFVFYKNASRAVSFHNPGDYMANGDYVSATNVNEMNAIVHVPVVQREGPNKDAPRWDWSKAKAKGTITANSFGYGSPRSVTVSQDGSLQVSYQAGIMIHDHGQYEGGGWPEKAVRGSRLLSFNKVFQPKYSVGRQSKNGKEAGMGVFFYPMQTMAGPNNTTLVNDQTKQPAQIWSHDGLFLGSVFDARANDGLDDGFYRVHGDDNQGGAITQSESGNTYWLMPYQAHNRLYEITGWNDWQRSEGPIQLRRMPADSPSDGKGLSVTYLQNGKIILAGEEDLIYYERFGAERHADKLQGFYKATWTGYLTPPVTDVFQFEALLGSKEQLAIWIDGKPVYARTESASIDNSIQLTANHPHQIRVEYINPDSRAELNVLWSSQVLDIGRIPVKYLRSTK